MNRIVSIEKVRKKSEAESKEIGLFFSLNKARDSSQNFDSLKEETKEEQSKLKKKVSQVRIDRFNTILGSEQQFFFVRVDISILPPFGVIFEMIFGLE